MNNNQYPENKKSNRGLLHYQGILLFVFPILVIYTIYQSIKFRSLEYFLQRLGVFSKPDKPVDIWLHAASMGEVNAALPLLNAIHRKYPDKRFLLTTTTPTGAQLVKQKDLSNVIHQFLPIDYWFMVASLVNKYQPKCVLVIETELWPNLFRYCSSKNIPVCTVNGRLSHKTMETHGWIRDLYKTTLQFSSRVLTRSDNDSKAYIALGAAPEIVSTVGNIKFSANLNTPKLTRSTPDYKYILAASTRPNEELMIATAWQQLKPADCRHLLVIAPRHPQRANDIIKQLEPLNLSIAVRSRNDVVTEATDIYLVDTLGELVDFMADADAVFVGGSLVPIGGHNILEPAALGKPVLFGPHMENFSSEAEQLLNCNAALQVEDSQQLAEKLADIITNPEKYSELGSNAKQLIERNKDTADRYVTELASYLQ